MLRFRGGRSILSRGLATFGEVGWFVLAGGLIRTEVAVLRQVIGLHALSYEQKKGNIDGPVYELTRLAKRYVPLESSVAFLTPGAQHELFNFAYKASYYLYPRKISLMDPQTMDAGRLGEVDYLLAIVADDRPGGLAVPLSQGISLQSIFTGTARWQERGWLLGLYRVLKDRG